jgi:plasmid maintenance system killer protein
MSLTFDVNNIEGYKNSLDVTFKKAKLQKVCNSDKELQRVYGKPCARKFRARLDDLQAAPNLAAFRDQKLPGRCHELIGDRKGQLSLDLEHPLRLIFIPVGDGVKANEDGGLDWNSVTAVQIEGVEDTHD